MKVVVTGWILKEKGAVKHTVESIFNVILVVRFMAYENQKA